MAARALLVDVDWWRPRRVPLRVRTRLERLVQDLAPALNEFEASLHDLERLASNGREFLMPKIELTLPLYEEGAVFRLRLVRLDETRMILATRRGEAVAEVSVR